MENDKGNGDHQYEWQQPDNKNEFRFQIIHLLITAIICLFIGGYLGTRDSPVIDNKLGDLAFNSTAEITGNL